MNEQRAVLPRLSTLEEFLQTFAWTTYFPMLQDHKLVLLSTNNTYVFRSQLPETMERGKASCHLEFKPETSKSQVHVLTTRPKAFVIHKHLIKCLLESNDYALPAMKYTIFRNKRGCNFGAFSCTTRRIASHSPTTGRLHDGNAESFCQWGVDQNIALTEYLQYNEQWQCFWAATSGWNCSECDPNDSH